MPWEGFYADFALVQHVAPLCLHSPLAQLFPSGWAVLSLIFLDVYD
jgi:hypothetical protein